MKALVSQIVEDALARAINAEELPLQQVPAVEL